MKYLEYFGLLLVTIFSFYYTDKITNYLNSKDPIMNKIIEYKSTNDIECIEGYTVDNNVTLGVSGKVININESYSNMQGVGYDENLISYSIDECAVNTSNTFDNIINNIGNDNRISLLIDVLDRKYLDNMLSYDKNIGILINSEELLNNKEYYRKLYNKGYSIYYKGGDIESFIDVLKEYDKNYNTYCIILDSEFNNCINKKINRIKTDYYFSKNIYNNIKNNIEKGGIYIIKENKYTNEELNSILNFIKSKNYEIIDLNDLN